jgi:hypothetical protein
VQPRRLSQEGGDGGIGMHEGSQSRIVRILHHHRHPFTRHDRPKIEHTFDREKPEGCPRKSGNRPVCNPAPDRIAVGDVSGAGAITIGGRLTLSNDAENRWYLGVTPGRS